MSSTKSNPSFDNFYESSERIDEFINSILWLSGYVEKLNESFGDSPPSKFSKKVKEHSFLDSKTSKMDFLFETCFIRKFATFEAFMYEHLKELYSKYPNSIPNDKKISISEILRWRNVESIFEFVIDYMAIENSFDASIWERTLKNSFKIEIFDSKDERDTFNQLNMVRNTILHSGGKTNSKVFREYFREHGSLFTEIQEYKYFSGKWEYKPQELFGTFNELSNSIVKRLKKNIA